MPGVQLMPISADSWPLTTNHTDGHRWLQPPDICNTMKSVSTEFGQCRVYIVRAFGMTQAETYDSLRRPRRCRSKFRATPLRFAPANRPVRHPLAA